MLESQEHKQEEIEYNNPRNEMDMDSEKIDDLKENLLNDNSSHDNENLQLPKLKFRWLWLLFGIAFFIDLYRYVTQLKQSCTDYQKKTVKQEELIDKYFDGQYVNFNMNNNIEELKFSKNKYENELISKENQIKELKVKLKYLKQQKDQQNKRIEALETKLNRCYKRTDAIALNHYKRFMLHKQGKYDKFLETRSIDNMNRYGENRYIRNEDGVTIDDFAYPKTASDKNSFLI